MTILDRYVLQKFLAPFLYCFVGFIAIWFTFDLSVMQGKTDFQVLRQYYASRIPEIIVICLPIGTLLALLYSLTAMSRSNGIISMIGAGLSVTRILVPLIIGGLLLTGVTAACNYSGAPHAAAARKQMLRDIKSGQKREVRIEGHLFRICELLRTWFVRKIMVSKELLKDVQILQQNEAGDILRQWFAGMAVYDPETKKRGLDNALYVEMNPAGEVVNSIKKPSMTINGWNETPWRIMSSVMNPDFLAVNELKDYLHYNSDFPEIRLAPYRTQLQYRRALPWVCLVVIFLAAPMGIVYSRRGILGGVAAAIGLFFSLVFTSSLFIAPGKGGRVSAFDAAWGPMIAFFVIGLLLLWYRSTNRDLPKLRIPGF